MQEADLLLPGGWWWGGWHSGDAEMQSWGGSEQRWDISRAPRPVREGTQGPGVVSGRGEGNGIPGLQGHIGAHHGEAPLAYN